MNETLVIEHEEAPEAPLVQINTEKLKRYAHASKKYVIGGVIALASVATLAHISKPAEPEVLELAADADSGEFVYEPENDSDTTEETD